jgi:DNA-binding NarL/FixJ family response regulator
MPEPGKTPDAPLQGPFFMYAESAQTAGFDFRWTPSMRRILFVDDHPIYRDGVRRVLESSGPDVQVLTADGASAALKLLSEASDIDLCLTDQRLLDGEGASLARQIRELYPSIAVGLLCAEPTLTLANEMRAIGA